MNHILIRAEKVLFKIHAGIPISVVSYEISMNVNLRVRLNSHPITGNYLTVTLH